MMRHPSCKGKSQNSKGKKKTKARRQMVKMEPRGKPEDDAALNEQEEAQCHNSHADNKSGYG